MADDVVKLAGFGYLTKKLQENNVKIDEEELSSLFSDTLQNADNDSISANDFSKVLSNTYNINSSDILDTLEEIAISDGVDDLSLADFEKYQATKKQDNNNYINISTETIKNIPTSATIQTYDGEIKVSDYINSILSSTNSLTEEQTKEYAINFLNQTLTQTKEVFAAQKDSEGIVSSGYNFLKELTGLGTSDKDIEKQIANQEEMINALNDALNGKGDLSFEEVWKKYTGADYSKDKMDNYIETSTKYQAIMIGCQYDSDYMENFEKSTGQNINDIMKDFISCKQETFGKDFDLESTFEKYQQDQQSFTGKLSTAMSMAGLACTLISFVCPAAGVVLLPVGRTLQLGGMFIDNGLDLIDKATDKDGLTSSEIKDLAIETGTEALGFLAGRKIGGFTSSLNDTVKNTLLKKGTSEIVSKVVGQAAETASDATLSLLADYTIAQGESLVRNGELLDSSEYWSADRFLGEGKNQLIAIISGVAQGKVSKYQQTMVETAKAQILCGDVDSARESIKKSGMKLGDGDFDEFVDSIKIEDVASRQQTSQDDDILKSLSAESEKLSDEQKVDDVEKTQDVVEDVDNNVQRNTYPNEKILTLMSGIDVPQDRVDSLYLLLSDAQSRGCLYSDNYAKKLVKKYLAFDDTQTHNFNELFIKYGVNLEDAIEYSSGEKFNQLTNYLNLHDNSVDSILIKSGANVSQAQKFAQDVKGKFTETEISDFIERCKDLGTFDVEVFAQRGAFQLVASRNTIESDNNTLVTICVRSKDGKIMTSRTERNVPKMQVENGYIKINGLDFGERYDDNKFYKIGVGSAGEWYVNGVREDADHREFNKLPSRSTISYDATTEARYLAGDKNVVLEYSDTNVDGNRNLDAQYEIIQNGDGTPEYILVTKKSDKLAGAYDIVKYNLADFSEDIDIMSAIKNDSITGGETLAGVVTNPDGSITYSQKYSFDDCDSSRTYTQKKDGDGNIVSTDYQYKIVDDNGKSLLDLDRSWAKNPDGSTTTVINGKKYVCAFDSENLTISVSDETGKTRVIDIKNKLDLGDNADKGYNDYFQSLKQYPADVLVELDNNVEKINISDLYSGAYRNSTKMLNSPPSLAENAHEVGHSIDFNNNSLSWNKAYLEIYKDEFKNLFLNYPDAAQEIINYFSKGTEAGSGESEMFAEVVSLLTTYGYDNELSGRGAILIKYFPKTIAKIAELKGDMRFNQVENINKIQSKKIMACP